jgi:hypothetical protein
MMAVMRRLIKLEQEFCYATAEELCLTRLAVEMQCELEALHFEAATQADAREWEQQACCICYDDAPISAGVGCKRSADHFNCANRAPREVQRILEAIQEAEPVACHRAQGGRILCVQKDCNAPHAESALALALPDGLSREYRAAQDHGEPFPRGRCRISNACPSCGFFSKERGDLVRWDGQLR